MDPNEHRKTHQNVPKSGLTRERPQDCVIFVMKVFRDRQQRERNPLISKRPIQSNILIISNPINPKPRHIWSSALTASIYDVYLEEDPVDIVRKWRFTRLVTSFEQTRCVSCVSCLRLLPTTEHKWSPILSTWCRVFCFIFVYCLFNQLGKPLTEQRIEEHAKEGEELPHASSMKHETIKK